jgi:hypothetical protein
MKSINDTLGTTAEDKEVIKEFEALFCGDISREQNAIEIADLRRRLMALDQILGARPTPKAQSYLQRYKNIIASPTGVTFLALPGAPG